MQKNAIKGYNLNDVIIVPKVSNAFDVTEEDILNVLKYIQDTNIFCRGMLDKCKVEKIEDKIVIYLNVPNAKFLLLKKVNERIEKVIKDFYGKEYKVDIKDSKDAEEVFERIKEATKVQESIVQEVKHESKPQAIEQTRKNNTYLLY